MEKPEGRYNEWGYREPLVCADKQKILRAHQLAADKTKSPAERSALYFKEITGVKGLEIVVFSNAEIARPVHLTRGIVLFPCFLSDKDKQSVNDPLAVATMHMRQDKQYVYDGWLPITDWSGEGLRYSVESLDQTLSLFCLLSRSYMHWVPKYGNNSKSLSTYPHEENNLDTVEEISVNLEQLNMKDREAIYRSLGWLAYSVGSEIPMAKFLFSILAVESLASYLFSGVEANSVLRDICINKLNKAERRQQAEACIKAIMAEEEVPLKNKINNAYFDCITGIREKIKKQMEYVLGDESWPVSLFFEKEDGKRSLYEIRSKIAHGALNAISDIERAKVSNRCWDAEKAAKFFVLKIIKAATGMTKIEEVRKGTVAIDLKDMIFSRREMYHGETLMALLYTNPGVQYCTM